MKKFLLNIAIIFIASASLFSQEYEIAWEKDIGGSYAQFSKDGEFIYVANGSLIQKYRSSDGSFVSSFDYSGLTGSNITSNFYISQSGNYLISKWAISKTEGYIYFWDLKTEKAIKRLNIGYSDFIDDNRMIITEYQHPATKLMIYDFLTEKVLKTKTSNENFNLIKVSHNGKLFATASFSLDGSKYYLTLWDTETLTEIKRFEVKGEGDGTTFNEIKFSWDDKYVGIGTRYPYEVNIFDTENYQKIINSAIFDNRGCNFFNFIKNYTLLYFEEWEHTVSYSLFLINNNQTKYKYNIECLPLTTSSNDLIFTGKALLRPKTIDVQDPKQQNISISNLKDLIIIDNKSELNKETEITIFDIQGKIVLQNSLLLNFGINKFAVPKPIQNGAYIIQLVSKNINISQKILIQR